MEGYIGLTIGTHERVYEPAEDSYLAAGMIEKHVSKLRKKDLDIIDIGTGTGILGLAAAMSGKASTVTLVDINEDAVALAKANAEKNASSINSELKFIVSDLFNSVSGKYDLIIFNAPYLRSGGPKGSSRDWEGGRLGVELSMRFLDEAAIHMKAGGRILLVASSLSDVGLLKQHIKKKGLKIYKIEKQHIFFEDIFVFLLG